MPRFNVALLAEPRHSQFQHLLMVGTMGIMAVGTVFQHRRMFPQERPPLFRVTTVANFICCVSFKQLFTGRAVRVMTGGAGHFSFK